MSNEQKLSFEQAVEELETAVNKLENSDLSLEEALEEFESGVKLAKFCASKLDQAEERVEIIKQEAEELIVEPYNLDRESEE